MKLTKFFQFLMLGTCLALIYIHMQMQIFNLAYQGKTKERDIAEFKDLNARVVNDILRLKSANYMGVRFLDGNSDLKFNDQKSSFQLVTSEVIQEAHLISTQQSPKIKKSIFSLLSSRSQAEARNADDNAIKPWHRPSEW